jgi:hypothetical protein
MITSNDMLWLEVVEQVRQMTCFELEIPTLAACGYCNRHPVFLQVLDQLDSAWKRLDFHKEFVLRELDFLHHFFRRQLVSKVVVVQ